MPKKSNIPDLRVFFLQDFQEMAGNINYNQLIDMPIVRDSDIRGTLPAHKTFAPESTGPRTRFHGHPLSDPARRHLGCISRQCRYPAWNLPRIRGG
jgi:hypothetical protein